MASVIVLTLRVRNVGLWLAKFEYLLSVTIIICLVMKNFESVENIFRCIVYRILGKKINFFEYMSFKISSVLKFAKNG